MATGGQTTIHGLVRGSHGSLDGGGPAPDMAMESPIRGVTPVTVIGNCLDHDYVKRPYVEYW
jgi:hypothetical protein